MDVDDSYTQLKKGMIDMLDALKWRLRNRPSIFARETDADVDSYERALSYLAELDRRGLIRNHRLGMVRYDLPRVLEEETRATGLGPGKVVVYHPNEDPSDKRVVIEIPYSKEFREQEMRKGSFCWSHVRVGYPLYLLQPIK